MTGYVRYRLARRRLHSAILAMAVTSGWVIPASGQNPAVSVGAGERTRGGVPNDPASSEVSRLKKFGIYSKQYA